jgi:hypothetical protein
MILRVLSICDGIECIGKLFEQFPLRIEYSP